MCGIAGIFDVRKSVDVRTPIEAMVQYLDHRGPDDRDIVTFQTDVQVGLGHTRLAIIDLSASGHQPMFNESRDLCLTYNGECYNYIELRKELSDDAREWESETDTEVVLRAYERWGFAAFQKLRGMFALALWDGRRNQLVLARDQFGIKPVYYYCTDTSLVFASELGALLTSDLVPRRIDPVGLLSYLQNGSVTSPDTIIKDVRLLPAGNCLVVASGGVGKLDVREVPFTENPSDVGASPRISGRPDAVRTLRETLKESVRLHLVSDVPLGLFLSGGMDSSALVALMSQVSDERPKTFSVVFAEEKFSEAVYARQIAKKFETEHHEIHLGEQQLLDMLPAAIAAEDQPTMDGINTFVVSKAVKEAGITVALSGLGGDELFAGYPTFRRALRVRTAARLPNSLRQGVSLVGKHVWNGSVQQKKLWQLLESDGSPAAAYAVSRQLFFSDDVESLLLDQNHRTTGVKSFPANEHQTTDTINEVSLYELRGYMANTLLRDTDCMSMAHSLEVRVPFIDAKVINLVLGFPGVWKLNGGRQKPLLQDALGDLLPPEVIHRSKMGFTLPLEQWMQSRLHDQIATSFADEAQFRAIGLQPARVRDVWQQFLNAPQAIGWSRPWALYVLGRWCTEHGVTL